jgi:hypothetical protein
MITFRLPPTVKRRLQPPVILTPEENHLTRTETIVASRSGPIFDVLILRKGPLRLQQEAVNPICCMK